MKKVRVFCDSYTAALGIFWFIFGCPWSLFSIFAICSLYNRGQTEKEAVVMVVTMILPFIFLLSYFSLRLCDMVELDSEGISLCSVFKKYPKIPYEQFGYFQIAYYYHYSQKRVYVVMGRFGVPPEKLARINQVKCSENLVKIKLSKKTYRILNEFLPELQRAKLERAMNGDLDDVGFDTEGYLRQKQRHEQQRRRNKSKKKK